eukprot:5427367-Amphidinium_carterae.1
MSILKQRSSQPSIHMGSKRLSDSPPAVGRVEHVTIVRKNGPVKWTAGGGFKNCNSKKNNIKYEVPQMIGRLGSQFTSTCMPSLVRTLAFAEKREP